MLLQTVKSRFNNKDGFTLIEVLIALVILTVAMLGVGGMQIAAVRGNAFGKEMQTAVLLGRDMIERVMASDYNDVTAGNVDGLLAPGVDEKVALELSPGLEYKRKWIVTKHPLIPNGSTVTTTVTWDDSSGGHSIELKTIIVQ